MANAEFQQFFDAEYHSNQMNTYYDRLVDLGVYPNMEGQMKTNIDTNSDNLSKEIKQCFYSMELHALVRDSFDLEEVGMSNGFPNYRNHFYDLLMFIIKYRTVLPQELIFMTVQYVECRVASVYQ